MITLIYGPPACGKTRNKEFLKEKYNAKRVIDGFYPMTNRMNSFRTDNEGVAPDDLSDCLILTNVPKDQAEKIASKIGASCFDFETAIQGTNT